MTILLLEDSEDDALLIKNEIEDRLPETDVIIVGNKEEFIAELNSNDLDILVTDINIPGYSGLEALQKAKSIDKYLPVIILSGTITENQAQEFLVDHGASDFINKNDLSRLYPAIKREHDNAQMKKKSDEQAKWNKILSEVVNQTKQGVIVTDSEGLIIWVNEAYEEITGYSLEECKGRKPGNVLRGEGTDRDVGELLTNKITQGKPVKSEILNYTKSGDTFWSRLNIFPLKDSNQQIIHFAAIQEDVTEQKEINKQLERLKSFYELSIDAAKIGLWELNLDDYSVYYNEYYFSMLGYSEDEVAFDKSFHDEVIHPDDADLIDRYIAEIHEGSRTSFSTMIRMKSKSGEYRHLIDQAKVVAHHDNGEPKILAGSHFDITELIETKRELELLNEEKSTLLKEIHHRVKNNLAVISGFLWLEREKLKSEEAFTIITKSINRIKSIANVHELFYQSEHLSRISAKEYFYTLGDDIIANSTFDTNTNVELDLEIDDVLINLNEIVPVGLLLNELITNSCKYAFNGKKGRISIKAELVGDLHSIHYSDNGKGVGDNFDLDAPKGMGTKIIKVLLNQLEADYKVGKGDGFDLSFEFNPKSKGSSSSILSI